MPKIKTNKAVKKRFKVTKTGKVLASSTLRRHMLTDRSHKKKRQARRWWVVGKTEATHMKALIPYDV